MLFCNKMTPPGRDGKMMMIYSNEPKKISNKLQNQFGESGGESGGATASTAHLPLFAHCCHFWPPHAAPYPSDLLHRLRHIIGDYFALRSRMCCILRSELSRETCHPNIGPAGSLLFADLFCCCFRSANSQCNACLELLCFAFRTLKWSFLQLRTHQHDHLTAPSEGFEPVHKANSELRQQFNQHR